MAEDVDLLARGWTGDPEGLVREAGGGRRCKAAVEGKRGLEGDKGRAGADKVSERLVENASLLFENSDGDLDARGLKFGDTSTADERVGIAGGDDDT
jgi:hypothetical protein